MPPSPASVRPLHERVAARKHALGLTDEQLAHKLGISRHAFLRRRLGRAPFAAREYRVLAELLETTVDDLMAAS